MRAYERLLKYVVVDTQSDPESASAPSAFKEFDLLKLLKAEVEAMGLKAELTDTGYLHSLLPGNTEAKAVGFISHVDTAQGASGKDVKPRIIENWDGSDIVLNERYTTEISQFPEMKRYTGLDLMVTDGNTLLGADDKAGVAEIMTMVQYLLDHPEVPHGDIWFAFTPDEEIGRGTENFELEKFKAEFAYTVDGDVTEGIEYECFNAASAFVTAHGAPIHPGSAKDKMINALNVAHAFHGLLPEFSRPEHTEGREGFIHLDQMSGEVDEAKLQYIIRDHDREKFENFKKVMLKAAEYINARYGREVITVEIKDSYKNMAECFKDRMYVVDIARAAIRKAGMEPVSKPIRGGTDGASLTYMGLPCPNIGTGCGNYHGRYEYAVLQEMDKAVEVLLNIVDEVVRYGK